MSEVLEVAQGSTGKFCPVLIKSHVIVTKNEVLGYNLAIKAQARRDVDNWEHVVVLAQRQMEEWETVQTPRL